jgi:intracellular sulfur oxidation DsrE/DsrF family protein
LIVHGPAAFTLLNDSSYEAKFGVKNPNIPVYQALKAAGVRVIICGQSLYARDIPRADLWSETEVALSALTTITSLVSKGFIVFKW